MPELRKDPIIGRWVIIATERAKRPSDFAVSHQFPPEGKCPFCEGNESQTPPEIIAIRPPRTPSNSPGWKVRVVPSIAPMLRIEGQLGRRPMGLYDIMNGVGAHEVFIETPEHIANMADLKEERIARVIDCYVKRVVDLEKDRRFKYILIFKNYGWVAGGGRIRHSRSQLTAMPVNPKRVKEELVGAQNYFLYKERCVFCDLIRQELQEDVRVIVDIDGFVAIASFASRFPFEVWILPKEHSCDFARISDWQQRDLAKILKMVLLKIKNSLNDPPYNIIFHTAPFRRKRPGYWRTIEEDYHWHIEIMPRLTRVAGFEWGTGFYICPVPPEEAARYLRELQI